jgi:hypothetical protein
MCVPASRDAAENLEYAGHLRVPSTIRRYGRECLKECVLQVREVALCWSLPGPCHCPLHRWSLLTRNMNNRFSRNLYIDYQLPPVRGPSIQWQTCR